jgi:hypothetical protein
MSDDIRDQLKSFVLGIVFPLALAFLAAGYMDGAEHHTRHRLSVLTPVHAFGHGLWRLGIALGIHAFFFSWYDNHPRIKLAVVAVAVISFFVGLYVQFS